MYGGYKQQEAHPVPVGSNPLWLEKDEKRNRFKRFFAVFLLLAIFIGSYFIILDYFSAYDPNSSECMMGFVDTECLDGYKCVGMRVPCEDIESKFKYRITGLVFPEKKCKSPVIYKEVCVPEKTAD